MSKLIDRLNQVAQAAPQSMGFRATQCAPRKPKILLIASLAQTTANGLADYVTGADAGLLRMPKLSSGAKTLKEMSRVMPGTPWGGWLKHIDRKGIKQMVKAGGDFAVFPAADTPLAILQDSEMGKILEVETSLSEGLLRAVNELPVDAVLIADRQEEHFLTWHHLMLFRRFADLLTKPLLVSIPSNVEADELQALWEAGVDGVVTEVATGQPAERLKELRQIIDNLDFPSQHKREKAKALLPYISSEATEDEGEEDEEE